MKIKYLVVAAVLITAIFGFGFVASAQTTDVQAQIAALQAMIQSLMQQIQALQAQQGTGTSWCYTFNTNLGFSQSGSADVGALHTILDKQGFSYAPDTGNTYDEGTAHAVIQLQSKHKILQTGYVGALTRAKLNALYGCGVTPPPVQPVPGKLTCTDSDNGLDYFTKGKTSWTTATGVQGSMTDFCETTSTLAEYSCDPDGAYNYKYTEYTCANGCLNGACVQSSTQQPAGILYFYGQGCPHCTNVDNYISANNIAQKVNFTKLETYNNTDNANFMKNDAAICGLSGSSLGVPFLWDGSKCYVGDTDVINFFSKYVSTQPSIKVTSPNGGEQWQVGQNYVISFYQPSTSASSLVYLDKGYSTGSDKSGVNSSMLITKTDPGVQSISYTIPQSIASWPGLGSNYTVRVCNADASGCDSSDNYFTISAPVATQPTITVTSPNGGETWKVGERHNITWSTTNFNGSSVDLQLCDTSAYGGIGACSEINSALVPNSGNYSWTIPSQMNGYPFGTGSIYKIEAMILPNGVNGSAKIDYSDNTFSITNQAAQPTVAFTSPVGSEHWAQGSTQNIQWSVTNPKNQNMILSLSTYPYSSSNGLTQLTNTVLDSVGNYSWQIPTSLAAGSYQLVIDDGTRTVSNSFSVVAPATAVTSPKSGDTLTAGQTYTVSWTGVNSHNVSDNTGNVFLMRPGLTGRLFVNKVDLSGPGSFSYAIPVSSAPGYYTLQFWLDSSTSINSDVFIVVTP